MRYRTGPVAGTLLLSVLAVLGVVGEIVADFRGQSVGSSIFGLVVIVLFAGLAASGLNDLRGVRSERSSDGEMVLKLPRLLATRDRGWRTIAADDIETIFLVLVSRRSRLYNLVVTLRDGSTVRSGAVAVRRPARVDLADTNAARLVEQMSHDLGIDRGRL